MSTPANVAPRESRSDEEPTTIRAGSCIVSAVDGYERWAPTYDRAPNPLLAREERYLLPLLAELQGKPILDLACGTGRWLEKLAAQGGGLAVGVDRSEAMLRVGRKKNSIRGRLTQALCESLPFRSACFDLAICSFAMGHIRELGPMVRELARVVRPKGDVFVSDLHFEAYQQGWRVGFRDESAAIQIETHPRSAEEMIRTFYAQGFECLNSLPLCLGRSEEPIFAQAGKAHAFADACKIPAILTCHFKRVAHRAAATG